MLQSEMFLRLVHHLRLSRNLTITAACAVQSAAPGTVASGSDCHYQEVWIGNGRGSISVVEFHEKKTAVTVRLLICAFWDEYLMVWPVGGNSVSISCTEHVRNWRHSVGGHGMERSVCVVRVFSYTIAVLAGR